MIRVFVSPIPLITNDLQRHFGILRFISEIKNFKRWDGDNYKYKDWNTRPKNFQRRVVSCFRRRGVRLGPKPNADICHQTQNKNCDYDLYPSSKNTFKSYISSRLWAT